MEKLLKALYYNRKRFIVQFGKQMNIYPKAYIYAIENDCYPCFHSTDEDSCYEQLYIFSKSLVEEIFTKVEAAYVNKDYKTFYDWEDVFGGEYREAMIIIFRYFYLENRFNQEFWHVLIDHEHNPDEANIIVN